MMARFRPIRWTPPETLFTRRELSRLRLLKWLIERGVVNEGTQSWTD